MIGEDVINSAIKDVKSFHNNDFILNYTLNSDCNIACVRGTNENSNIHFNADICNMSINEDADFIFVLFIACHEIAHYLHNHNSHKDIDGDSKLIEGWADFYGMKLLMTVLGFGEHTFEKYVGAGYTRSLEVVTKNIGISLKKCAETIFNVESNKYDPRLERVMHCASGVNSFLDTFFSRRNINRSLNVLRLIYQGGGLEKIVESDLIMLDPQKEFVDRCSEIHMGIQGESNSITHGLLDRYKPFINTDYRTTLLQRNIYRVDNSVEYLSQLGIESLEVFRKQLEGTLDFNLEKLLTDYYNNSYCRK